MRTAKEPGKIASRQRAKSGQEKELAGHKFKLVDKGFDPAEICSFLGTLIEENNTLLKKLQRMDSLMELAEDAVAGARKQAERITLEAEEEASSRASALIAEAEQRAKAESDRIISEAGQEAEGKAEEIKAQAEKEASRTLAEANQKAAELISQRMSSAEQEAREVVRQKKEQFRKAYQKMLESLDSIDITDISAKLSMEDILCTSEESEATAAPQKARTLNVNIPLKVLPGFLRQRVNKSQPPNNPSIGDLH